VPVRSLSDKIATLNDVPSLVTADSLIGIGGVLLRRKPMSLLKSLFRVERNPIRAITFLGGFEVEWLAAHGRIAELTSGYVGLESYGGTPAWNDSLNAGSVVMHELSELMFVTGLRASASGVSFLPSRGAAGSDLAITASLREIECPYTKEKLWAIPALRPDVSLIHAERADRFGNVDAPGIRDFLWDSDLTLARASQMTIVSVEHIVDTDELTAPVLFAHEIDHVIEVRGGAAPTELPGQYLAQRKRILQYLSLVKDGHPCHSAMIESFAEMDA